MCSNLCQAGRHCKGRAFTCRLKATVPCASSMGGLPAVNQLRQHTNSCRNRSRFNFAVGIFDSFRQAREVVTLSLRVFVACDTFGKCGRQSEFGTLQ